MVKTPYIKHGRHSMTTLYKPYINPLEEVLTIARMEPFKAQVLTASVHGPSGFTALGNSLVAWLQSRRTKRPVVHSAALPGLELSVDKLGLESIPQAGRCPQGFLRAL